MVARWFLGGIRCNWNMEIYNKLQGFLILSDTIVEDDTLGTLLIDFLLVYYLYYGYTCTRARWGWKQPVYMFSVHDLVFLLFYMC